jgi:uncharacterized membrane protein YdjX (TVP38/TMEM64 family)
LNISSIKNYSIKSKVFASIFFLCLLIVGIFLIPKFIDIDWLRNIIASKGWVTYPAYILLQILQGLSIFIPLSPVTVTGGIVFGSSLGILLSWIGVFCSQLIAFWLARIMGQDFVLKRVSGIKVHWLCNIVDSQRLNNKYLLALIAIYCSGVVSFDLLAYSLGLTRMKTKWMILIAGIGIIPKLIVLNVLGDTFSQEKNYGWLFGIIATIIFIVILSSIIIFKGATRNLEDNQSK